MLPSSTHQTPNGRHFPTHRLFQGMLPIAMRPLSDRLKGFDLAVVIGAPVFRYHAYVAGPVLPEGCELLQITNDPSDASSALVGDSLLGDARLTLEALIELVEDGSSRTAPKPLNLSRTLPSPSNSPLTIGGMDRQTLRDWVIRFNEQGPDGLVNKLSPGAPGELPTNTRRFSPASWRKARSQRSMASCAGGPAT